jgi:hypothetical protein
VYHARSRYPAAHLCCSSPGCLPAGFANNTALVAWAAVQVGGTEPNEPKPVTTSCRLVADPGLVPVAAARLTDASRYCLGQQVVCNAARCFDSTTKIINQAHKCIVQAAADAVSFPTGLVTDAHRGFAVSGFVPVSADPGYRITSLSE